MQANAILIYALPLAIALVVYWFSRMRREKADRGKLRESEAAGLTEPPSLHPEFDTARCIGSGACVKACPEQAIGIVGGKARLVNPSVCIGHGACHAVCPMDAIQLFFGTARRGIDIPQVDPNFETNVPGLFIAGELGGMGLIHKAVEQGRSAVRSVASRGHASGMLDLIIVGAGPSGIAASLAAKNAGLRFATIEQENSLGGTVYHYPRNKVAMTSPMHLPTVGRIKLGEVSKEALLAFWSDVIKKARLDIQFQNRMLSIEKAGDGFRIGAQKGNFTARHVLLAIGRRGTPRTLDVPGEDLPKVVYRMIDPEQYRGQRVLVVGGGDSAIEAAIALAEVPGCQVSLSYRSAAFNRIKPANRERLNRALTLNTLRVLLSSEVREIGRTDVVLIHEGRPFRLGNDAIIVCAGGVLPSEMLRSLGILVQTHFGRPVHDAQAQSALHSS